MWHEFHGRYNPDKFAAVESFLCKQTFPTFNKPIQNQERKKKKGILAQGSPDLLLAALDQRKINRTRAALDQEVMGLARTI
jgi:hypothetical protein